jgi:protocatechuate 3,4-dioxygenase, beta subunit
LFRFGSVPKAAGERMRDSNADISRRKFVTTASLAMGAVAFSTARRLLADDVARRETADVITGPFYPQLKPRDTDADLALIRGHRQRAAGQVVQLSGRVVNLRGEPVRNARIEIWQANTHGRYAHASDPHTELAIDPNFQGYAVLRTDRDGRYAFTTIKPGPYPTARGDMRAPHIHFDIHGAVDRKVTQLFFPNEPLNDQDRHLQAVRRPETLIASVSAPSSDDSVLVASWDIFLTTG